MLYEIILPKIIMFKAIGTNIILSMNLIKQNILYYSSHHFVRSIP